MKHPWALLVTVLIFATSLLHATEAVWFTDYQAALKKAAAEQKPLLLDFTGSDWCGWCMKLDKEVFSQAEFTAYAAKNLILVKVDFPRLKQQSEVEKKQNSLLSKKYKIPGFPTIVVLDEHGAQLGELGYAQGGPKPWITELEKIIKQKAN